MVSTFTARIVASSPWGIDFKPIGHSRVVIVTRGACWLITQAREHPVSLAAGDCVIFQAHVPFVLVDEPGSELVDCEEVFAQVSGNSVEWGGGGTVSEILAGRFAFDSSAAEPLTSLLPDVLHLRLNDANSRLLQMTLQLLEMETSQAGTASSLIAGRLADVLFIQAIRAWSAGETTEIRGWLGAMRHPQLASALRAMHGDLAHPWTVEGLARHASMSRSAFATAFKHATGVSPMRYLSSWRIYHAKMLMRATDLALAEVARRVGYETDTALSRAFRKHSGLAPGAWRQRERLGADSR